jgi:hypothetical protein
VAWANDWFLPKYQGMQMPLANFLIEEKKLDTVELALGGKYIHTSASSFT